MKILSWNIRGLGQPIKSSRLGEIIRDYGIDLVGLQETKKEDFEAVVLNKIDKNGDFNWEWVPSKGSAGGIMCGYKKEKYDCLNVHKGDFCLALTLVNVKDGFSWQWIVVYGPVVNEEREDFVLEMNNLLSTSVDCSCVCGDFNMIRAVEEKNNDNIHWNRVELFNDFITQNGLIEIKNSGKRYTWSNNQSKVVLQILDRFLVSSKWEERFPLSTVTVTPRLFSDHAPIFLDTMEEEQKPPHHFRYERWWELEEGFCEAVAKK